MYDKNDNLISHFDSTRLFVYAIRRLESQRKHYNSGNIQGLKSKSLQTIFPIYRNEVIQMLGNNIADFIHIIIQS